MTKLWILVGVAMLYACSGHSQTNVLNQEQKSTMKDNTADQEIHHTEAEWKEILTPQEYHVLREKGTDRPFQGKYYLHKEKGVYTCAGCGTVLFTSDMKFESSCGWPSFDEEIAGGKIKKVVDRSHGMVRTEIVCARCGSHLGHLFDDGPTLTGKRYCVNSTSIDFEKEEKESQETQKKK